MQVITLPTICNPYLNTADWKWNKKGLWIRYTLTNEQYTVWLNTIIKK
jgi:hypothetical protein